MLGHTFSVQHHNQKLYSHIRIIQIINQSKRIITLIVIHLEDGHHTHLSSKNEAASDKEEEVDRVLVSRTCL